VGFNKVCGRVAYFRKKPWQQVGDLRNEREPLAHWRKAAHVCETQKLRRGVRTGEKK
jgi:hypothetical protein